MQTPAAVSALSHASSSLLREPGDSVRVSFERDVSVADNPGVCCGTLRDKWDLGLPSSSDSLRHSSLQDSLASHKQVALLNQIIAMLSGMAERVTADIRSSQLEAEMRLQVMLEAMDKCPQEPTDLHKQLDASLLGGCIKEVKLNSDKTQGKDCDLSHGSLQLLVQQNHEAVMHMLEKLLANESSVKSMLTGHVAQMQDTSATVAVNGAALSSQDRQFSPDTSGAPSSVSKKKEAGASSAMVKVLTYDEIVAEKKGLSNRRSTASQSAVRLVESASKCSTVSRNIVESKWFEPVVSAIIVVNAIVMLVELQLKGEFEGDRLLNERSPSFEHSWDRDQMYFGGIMIIFNIIYFVEMILCISVYGRQFFTSAIHIVDVVVVVLSWIEIFMSEVDVNMSIVRLLRLTRLSQIFRFSHIAEHLHELHVLLHTLSLAIRGLAWSVLLLWFFIVAGGAIVVQMVHSFLGDESISVETRKWAFANFGTLIRAVYTLWECTFTAAWGQYSRPLIEEVSAPIFSVFWVVYIVGVNFTVVRVVSSLFLKQTMQVAAHDEERLAKRQLKKEHMKFSHTLSEIFKVSDTSGDGILSVDEFHDMIVDDRIAGHFKNIGLEMDDVLLLFAVLSAEDGGASYEDFLSLSMQVNSPPTKMDIVMSFQRLLHIEDQVKYNNEWLQLLAASLVKDVSAMPQRFAPSTNAQIEEMHGSLQKSKSRTSKAFGRGFTFHAPDAPDEGNSEDVEGDPFNTV